MITAIAWAGVLAFVLLIFFAGLPEYVAGLQRQADKRCARAARGGEKTGL